MCIGQTHQNTTEHGIVFFDNIIFFYKNGLSRFTRKIPILPAYTGKMGFWSRKYGMHI